MSLKEATEKLRAVNDAIKEANEFSEQQRMEFAQSLNDLLIKLLIALVNKV